MVRSKMFMFAVFAVIVMMGSIAAADYDCQEWLTNDTGQKAYDLTKIVAGHVHVTAHYSGSFGAPAVEYHDDDDITSVHFSGGTGVNNGSSTYACFDIGAPGAHRGLKPIHIFWTDQYGQKIGSTVGVGHRTYMNGANVFVELGNYWRQWNGAGYPIQEGDGPGDPMGPISITQVYYATTNALRPLEDLNDDLFTDPEIEWHSLSGVVLNYGDTNSYNLGGLGSHDVVLFRFVAAGEGHTSGEIIQFRVDEIPTLSEWGLIIMAGLLLTVGAIVIRRKFKTVTA